MKKAKTVDCIAPERLFTMKGQPIAVATSKEVVLSAGAVNSPQILQLSGIGPAALLKEHGIDVVMDAPYVGENLQDHLQIRAVYKVKGTKTLNTLANSLVGKAKIGLEYVLKRSGPMSMSPSQLGAFTRSDPELPHANLEYHVQPLSLEAFGEDLHDFPAITVSVCNLNPTSRGHVRIASWDFRQPPEITPNYLDTDEDRKVAAQSLRQVREIMAQPPMEAYEPEEFKPGIQYQTDEELARLAGDIASTIFHPVGTIKMGREDDETAVLDPHLRMKRRGWPARGRCLCYARDHKWQHQLTHDHDRRERPQAGCWRANKTLSTCGYKSFREDPCAIRFPIFR